jgi:hypothetical protein
VDMAYSLFLHNRRHRHESESDFRLAWRLQDVRNSGLEIPTTCTEPDFLQYGSVCRLGRQVERLLSFVPKDRVLLVELENLQRDPRTEYVRILEFIGVNDDGRTVFPVENVARTARWEWLQTVLKKGGRLKKRLGIHKHFGLTRLNEQPVGRQPLEADFLSELWEYFESDYALLRSLVHQHSGGSAR